MNLEHITRVEDKDSHFLVHHAKKEKPIVVAKKGLNPATVAEIQKFCSGGKVHYDEGTTDAATPPSSNPIRDAAISFLSPQDAATPAATVPASPTEMITTGASPEPVRGLGLAPFRSDQPAAQPQPTTPAGPPAAQHQNGPPAAQPQNGPITKTRPTQSSPGSPDLNTVAESAKKAYGVNTDAQVAAMADLGQRNQVVKDASAQLLQDDYIANASIEKDRAARTAAYQKSSQAHWDQYMNGHVDPNQYMQNLGLGGQFQAGLSVLLSGIATGLGQHSNTAMEILQGKINQNIDDQKAQLLKQKEGSEHDTTAIANINAWAADARARRLQATAANIALIQAKNDALGNNAQVTGMIAKFNNDSALEGAKSVDASVTAAAAPKKAALALQAQRLENAKTAAETAKLKYEMGQKNDAGFQLPTGRIYGTAELPATAAHPANTREMETLHATNPAEQQKMTDRAIVNNQTIDAADKMQQLLDKNPNGGYPGADSTELRLGWNTLLTHLSQQYSARGQPVPAAVEALKNIDPSSLTAAVLGQVREGLKSVRAQTSSEGHSIRQQTREYVKR